ncbi:MAG: phosphoribosyl-AMP cyclohydrolase [bacterium]
MTSLLKAVKFNGAGLVPAVVQQGLRGRVLMVAWMNRRAFELTLRTGFSHFYSRSRKKLWKKGEESGHVQWVREIRVDCDGDVLLLAVDQRGAGACHTGHRSCFFRRGRGGRWIVVDRRRFDPKRAHR